MDGYLGYVDTGEGIIVKPVEPPVDNVSHPNHYQSRSGLECKDVIEAAVEDLVGYEASYTANAIKYLWRWKKKNGDEDLRKAKQYIDFILDNHLKEETK